MLVVSQQARLLAFAPDELKQMGRGRGLQLLALDDGDALTALGVVSSGRAVDRADSPPGRLMKCACRWTNLSANAADAVKEAPKRWLVLGETPRAKRQTHLTAKVHLTVFAPAQPHTHCGWAVPPATFTVWPLQST